jgi:hypothetical protein
MGDVPARRVAQTLSRRAAWLIAGLNLLALWPSIVLLRLTGVSWGSLRWGLAGFIVHFVAIVLPSVIGPAIVAAIEVRVVLHVATGRWPVRLWELAYILPFAIWVGFVGTTVWLMLQLAGAGPV